MLVNKMNVILVTCMISASCLNINFITIALVIVSQLLSHLIFCSQKKGANAKVGFSKAMYNGWLRLDKTAEGGARVFRKVL